MTAGVGNVGAGTPVGTAATLSSFAGTCDELACPIRRLRMKKKMGETEERTAQTDKPTIMCDAAPSVGAWPAVDWAGMHEANPFK
jgi:hypothetical protein